MATLIADLIDRVQQLSDRVDATKRAIALTAIDEAVQWYAKRMPMDMMQDDEVFLTNGSRNLVLPDRILKVTRVGDRSNARALDAGEHWAKRTPGSFYQDSSGAALEWRDGGFAAVIAQPATDTTLTCVNTVSDTIDVAIRGLVRDTTASGTSLELYEVQEILSLVSTTDQATTNAFVRVLSIQKEKNTLADITVTNDQTSLQISRIPTWETRPLFPRIQFHFIPLAGTSMEIDYQRRPDRIVSENDSLDPAIDEESVQWRAIGNFLFADNEDQGAQTAWGKSEEAIAIVRNVEETFGEKDFHVEPWPGYLGLEGLDDDEFYVG